MRRSTSRFVLLVLSLCLAVGAVCGPAGAYETPSAPPASSILPANMLSGPNFSVDPAVSTDGYLYIFELRTSYGNMRVASTALLAKRIAETAALAKMDQVNSLAQFGGGIVNKGEQTLRGAANLLSNPLGTLSGAVSGVGRMFENIQQSLSSGDVGGGQAASKILGVPELERQYALQFGVDPYTANPYVRERLHQLAVAGAAGNVTASALTSLIPGGAGIAVSAVGASAVLNGVNLAESPETLAKQNLAKLAAMGVPSGDAALFIGNQVFTPSDQARIVAWLAAMPGVSDKGAMVRFLAGTDDPDVARFRGRMVAMYAGYDANVAPLSRFMPVGRHIAALNASGKMVLLFPTDCFFWTRINADIARSFSEVARRYPSNGVEIRVAGGASRLFADKVRAMGWEFYERSAPSLLGEPY